MNHILKYIKKYLYCARKSSFGPKTKALKISKNLKKSGRPPTFWQKLRTLTNYFFLCGLIINLSRKLEKETARTFFFISDIKSRGCLNFHHKQFFCAQKNNMSRRFRNSQTTLDTQFPIAIFCVKFQNEMIKYS